MPRYDVQYVVALTSRQKEKLAHAITKFHSEAFTVPSLFVNVIYTDISQRTAYIGGKERQGNHILAHVRLGHREKEEFKQLCKKIEGAWEQIVFQPHANNAPAAANEWKLASLIMIPLDLVGMEAGFDVPLAGEEASWLSSNYAEFQRRADDGDEKMIDLVNEIKERGLLK